MPSRPLPLLSDLARSERQVYSQNGEDGVIRALLDAIGETNRFCVEFGVGDGTECCTRVLVEQGWSWLWLDGAAAGDDPRIHQAWVNAETIVPLFQMHKVPRELDVLSIDTDFNDAYLLAAILQAGFRPRLIVIESNAACGPTDVVAVRYDPRGRWNGTDYFGASLGALAAIGDRFGYRLVYCESNGTNAFFVRGDLFDASSLPPPAKLWHPPAYAPFPKDPDRVMEAFDLEAFLARPGARADFDGDRNPQSCE